jgi:hypothetical protein
MHVTTTKQAKGGVQAVQPILQTNTEFAATTDPAGNFVRAAQPSPLHVGYGLPCSNCGTYYTADQSVCPVCKCGKRISPTTLPAAAGLQNGQSLPDADEPAEEREPLPKEFKSQLFSTHLRINTAASFRCGLEGNRQGSHEPAEICRPCYDHLRERVDLMEAALHIDLKEAAQIVYDAVWSAPSDPKRHAIHESARSVKIIKRAGRAVG